MQTLGQAARAVIDPTIEAGRGLAAALGGAGGGGVARVPVRPGEQTGGLGVAIFDPESGAGLAEGVFGGGDLPSGFQGGGRPRVRSPERLRRVLEEARGTGFGDDPTPRRISHGGEDQPESPRRGFPARAPFVPPTPRGDRVAPAGPRDFSYGPITTSITGRISNATRDLQQVENKLRDLSRAERAKTKVGTQFGQRQNRAQLENEQQRLRRVIQGLREELQERAPARPLLVGGAAPISPAARGFFGGE